MAKGKLHEGLAVEGELEGACKAILQETAHTLKGKPDHFLGSIKTYYPHDAADPDVMAPEHKELVTTVNEKLAYMFEHVVRYLDVVAQKESTNQIAKADLVLDDGRVLAKDVPATFLLGLESKIKQWKEVCQEIPTLAPGVAWKRDETRGRGIYVAEHAEETRRTKKTVQHKVLVQPTKEHPAQIEKWAEDIPIGKFVTQRWCGMMSPAEKSELLGRLDELGRAAKKARQRANCAEIVSVNIGKTLADYVLKG